MDISVLSYLTVFAIICMIADYRYRRIPNIITYPSMLLGLIHHFIISGSSGLYFSCAGLLAGLSILLIPFIIGGMGPGDVKMSGAIGAITGVSGVIVILLYAALVGGFYAVAILMRDKLYQKQGRIESFKVIEDLFITRQTPLSEFSVAHNGPRLCYGIAIAIGAYIYIFELVFDATIISRSIFA